MNPWGEHEIKEISEHIQKDVLISANVINYWL